MEICEMTLKKQENLWGKGYQHSNAAITAETTIYKGIHLLKLRHLGQSEWAEVYAKIPKHPNYTYHIIIRAASHEHGSSIEKYTKPGYMTYVVTIYQKVGDGGYRKFHEFVEYISYKAGGAPHSEKLIRSYEAVYNRLYRKALDIFSKGIGG
jgi:hypothetical protein